MSEAENIVNVTPLAFPRKVWETLTSIDVDPMLKKKGKLDYLPWSIAWEQLMRAFPESVYEFDEPNMFPNGTGEQWVTVTVKEGQNSFQRRWWLPYMDYKNQPVQDPTAVQINNTRMRVLVKCLGMMGLGLHVYTGEDVPDKNQDANPVNSSKSVRAALLEEIEFDEAERDAWVERLREVMPDKDDIDFVALAKMHPDLKSMGDLKIAIWQELESWQRTALRKLSAEIQDRERQEAVDTIKGQS